MTWLTDLVISPDSVAGNVLVLALVIVSGLALGHVRHRGVQLGVAGVLFSGLIFGHFGYTLERHLLDFVREFGLILFVYSVGMGVGPGFFNALRAEGIRLNLLAAINVILGTGLTVGLCALLQIAPPVTSGIYSGACTNTPSLAASGQALREIHVSTSKAMDAVRQASPEVIKQLEEGSDPDRNRQLTDELVKLPSLGYAVTYPFGVIGTIITLLFLQFALGVDPIVEGERVAAEQESKVPLLQRLTIKLTNPNLDGLRITKIPSIDSLEVVISRVQRNNAQLVPSPDFILHLGDVLTAVGHPARLQDLQLILGEKVDIDLVQVPSPIHVRWLTVSRKQIVGKSIEELNFPQRFGANVTRIKRAEIELPPIDNLRLSLNDHVLTVGTDEAIAQVAHQLGDSPKAIEEPDLIPVFVGIALGVLLGSLPISLPGLASPIKLGLAGGPLIVAIFLSRFQRIGSLVWYLPSSATALVRNMGITFFLAAVGLIAGNRFVSTLLEGNGFLWLGLGIIVTLVPLAIVSALAVGLFKLPYLTIAGLLAGSMTGPPALAFINGQSKSESSSLAYATVYPLTMILRVVSAQLIVVWWAA